MKVLFPIGSFYPDQSGGPSNTIYWHSMALIRQNQEPIVVTTSKGIPENLCDNWQNTNYGRVIYIKNKFHYLPFRMIEAARRELQNVDIVHLTSLFYPPSLIIAFINTLFYHKPIIWSVRGELNKTSLSFKPKVKKILLTLVKLINKSITFHTTSKEETQTTQNIFSSGCKIVEIPNFLELPDLVERNNTIAPYLLFIGRIHPIKAINHLIEALGLSSFFRESNLILKIAGSDNNGYAVKLKELVAQLGLGEKVQFMGQIKDIEKEQLYANAYFTFLPSLTENFGNVVVESLAQGTPVVASLGTPWQLLEEKQAGFWTDNTPSVLAMVIDKILTLSPEDYANYRANAYRLATDHFDIHKNIHQWIDAYKQVLNES